MRVVMADRRVVVADVVIDLAAGTVAVAVADQGWAL